MSIDNYTTDNLTGAPPCVFTCYNCFGEKGFWIDRKDPRNPTYMQDNDEDIFEDCTNCEGTGNLSRKLHTWKDYEDQCDRTVKCERCGMFGERDSSVEGGVFYPAT
jgi:hypothetical protein